MYNERFKKSIEAGEAFLKNFSASSRADNNFDEPPPEWATEPIPLDECEPTSGESGGKPKLAHSVRKRSSPHTERILTEDAIALSFCKSNPDLRYVNTWGKWMTWNGKHWIEDETLSTYDAIRKHIRNVARGQKEFSKAKSVSAIEQLARSDRRYAATSDQWDVDDWILNTQGGIVDLHSGKTKEHYRQAYLRKITAATPSGGCPNWSKFLADITGNDREYIEFLKRVSGYALTGSIREHALFFLFGTGGNGKGTFLNTLKHVFGDYATVAPTETFTESKNERHPTDLAMLQGSRLVIAQETEEGKPWAEAKIKTLTGGDPITARFMRRDFFTYQPKFKLLIASNHKPRLKNVDEAMKRRFYLLPFNQCFNGARKNNEMDTILINESNGILKWMIEGCRNYLNDGLKPPEIVTAATKDYFETENIFAAWLDECCERGPDQWDTAARLFGSWKQFAEIANEYPGKQNTFGERLAGEGFVSGNTATRGGRHWKGLKLKPSDFDGAPHWTD